MYIIIHYHPKMRRGNAFGRVCVCVFYVCPVRALTFEYLDLETSVLVYANTYTASEHLGQSRVSRS